MPIRADRILYEDDQLLAVNKLSGELVVKGAGAVGKLPLLDFLKKSYPGLHPLQRLDFETSGVVVFAKNRGIVQQAIESGFEDWTKTYRTIVAGRFDRDTGAIHFKLPARSGKEEIEAHTTYRVLEKYANSAYLEVDITTGRHHQIRRHFAMIDHPLVLDAVYGNKKYNRVFIEEFKFHSFFLHAHAVTLQHPTTKKQLRIEAPLPPAFEGILKKLRKFRLE